MGAWLAFEVTHELLRRQEPLPAVLFVSGNRAPHLCGPANDVDACVMHQLPEEEFWQAMTRRYGPNPNLASGAWRWGATCMFLGAGQGVDGYFMHRCLPGGRGGGSAAHVLAFLQAVM